LKVTGRCQQRQFDRPEAADRAGAVEGRRLEELLRDAVEARDVDEGDQSAQLPRVDGGDREQCRGVVAEPGVVEVAGQDG
jgi:hypothetical protein